MGGVDVPDAVPEDGAVLEAEIRVVLDLLVAVADGGDDANIPVPPFILLELSTVCEMGALVLEPSVVCGMGALDVLVDKVTILGSQLPW